MNIQILHSWLLEHLETNAKPNEIATALSLSGPSVERVDKYGNDWLYDIEVTTNRVDMMSVRGIAREANVILPQHGYKAKLKPLPLSKPKTSNNSLNIEIESNSKLTKRVMGVILTDIKNWKSPDWMKKRLNASGIRSLNAVVDITNYVMLEIGHPTHVFDYEQVKPKMIVRESRKGEEIVSLEDKRYKLEGGDIVIENIDGEIIDLPGIIGTKNSVVNKNTKTILFFNETNDPVKIRKSSMTLGIRTVAATLNEKGVDPELAETALLRGIELYKDITKATVSSKIFDIYKNKYKPHSVKVDKEFIDKILGVEIPKPQIKKILDDLGFESKWQGNTIMSKVPSFRSSDILIPEDIVEEIARIYGYYQLPSKIIDASLPEPILDQTFELENKVRNLIKGWGGVEVYTLSLVSNDQAKKNSLKLKNPLGADTACIRTTLLPSLVNAANSNKGVDRDFHLYEIANTYLPKKGSLPNEVLTLAGIFSQYDYRKAKGIIEALLNELNIDFEIKIEDNDDFLKNQRIIFKSKNTSLGSLGVLKEGYIYYEFEIEKLHKYSSNVPKIKLKPKFPPQIEDITLNIPRGVIIAEVIDVISNSDELVNEISLVDVYNKFYTFRISYLHPEKTLTDKEVKEIREKYLDKLTNKLGVLTKD